MVAALLGMLGVAGLWLADQATFVTTTDARVRARMVTLSAEVVGRIVDMPVSAGDRVTSGQVLVRLDTERAKLALSAAALELKALEADVERGRLTTDMTRDRDVQRLTARQSSVDVAMADVAAAQAALVRAEADHRRAAALHATGVIAQAALDRAIAALEAARQARVAAEATLAERRAGLGQAQAEARGADIAAREADSLALSAHALRQRIALLKAELSLHAIASPIDGVIDEVFAEAGEHVSPGARLALAHAREGVWLEANIKETDLPRIALGADAEIRMDAARGTCAGVVERIGDAAISEFALIPNANPAGVFTKVTQRVPVRVKLGADCREARPGAMATLRIRAT